MAAVQAYLKPSDTITVPVTSAGTKGKPTTHADAVATAAAAAKALKLTSSDVVTVAAPLHTSFGFAAGCMAANSVNAKTGECCWLVSIATSGPLQHTLVDCVCLADDELHLLAVRREFSRFPLL